MFRPDPAGAAALRARLGLTAGDRVVLSPRLLSPLYNVHLVVAAMVDVLREVPAALLLVTEYGAEPAYRARVLDDAARLGLGGRVRLVGSVAHREMPALLSLADAVVSVPSSDGLPQSLFEAMACGTPVVLGRLPAYEEVVRDGESALLAELEPAAIAAALLRVLTDATRRESIARAARERVAGIASLPAEAARVRGLYEELLAAPRPAPRSPLTDGRAWDALSLLLR
jgi:glycosyltransferase involved in cell wall biosynthesis